jgi:uncharacterized protein YaaR (DUF327 family)
MDIDVQLKETPQYDTLKELLDIITKSGMFIIETKTIEKIFKKKLLIYRFI